MNLIVHRGTHQIGGSCIELQHDGSRIILDIGMPLPGPGERPAPIDPETPPADLIRSSVLPDVSGLYVKDEPSICGVVLSHAHQDHMGLAGLVHQDIPLFASKGTCLLQDVIKVFLPHVRHMRRPEVIEPWEPIRIGAFEVTPYLVDHSAPGALAVLVEAGGKRVFYSGDLRGHGRKSVLFERLLKDPPRNIDCLLLEGTMLGRPEQEFPTEQSVEEAMIGEFRQSEGPIFVFCSSQNIDRVVSVYRACLRADTTMVIDLYTAFVLRALAPLSSKLPQVGWRNIRVKLWKNHADSLVEAGHKPFLYECNKHRVDPDDITKSHVILARPNTLFQRLADSLPAPTRIQLTWSMWPGYLTPDNPIVRYAESHGLAIPTIHTSGHAPTDDLVLLADALKPKHTAPVHSELPEAYRRSLSNVAMLEDGESLDL